ncbi:unnamed protein product [Tilletia caries]|nr:unnamed protein product [Tilletia caries]CAD6936587.1 unnamed protein product [Tilletia caries]
MRILPRLNEDINEEWINDKTRFAYDGLKYQRLTTPLIRQGDRFVPASWPEALGTVAAGLAASGAKGDEIQAVAGALADTESLVVLKDLINSLGSDNLALDIVHLGLHGSRAATLQRRRNSTLRFLMRRQMPSPQFSRQSTTSPTHQRLCKSATSIRLGAWPMTILAAC